MAFDFISGLKDMLDQEIPNVSVTENGAVGYQTTGTALLDLNFKLSSMRNWDDGKIWTEFLAAYNENPILSVIWMFFARDARGGCGERHTFRVIFQHFAYESPDLAIKLLPLIPEYGRWDDLIDIMCGDIPCKVRDAAFVIVRHQLTRDLDNMSAGKPISLMAKWMPSNVTSSKETVRKAELIRVQLGMTPKKYRRTFADLRRYLDVTEQKMSANNWGDINYEAVSSKAGMLYRDAFMRHDPNRYGRYLEDVRDGKAKMNASVVFPYEIVHAYINYDNWDTDIRDYDETLELKWKNLPNTVEDSGGTLVVVDGSGSMSTSVGNTNVTCHDVARSLGIYFAERLTGAFKNSFITFSANPKLIRFNGAETLRSKLEILVREDDCSNTNIEKTFDLILRTATENHMKQEDMPKNILIVSDMEFDACTRDYGYNWSYTSTFSKPLFDEIADRWESAGYKLPRLVFWNVCSRSETIPVRENELGVALVSGFSPNIAGMVMSGDLDPWKLLVDQLSSDRYLPVWEAIS